MRKTVVIAGFILSLLAEPALACRPHFFDPLEYMAQERAPEFTTVFVGEIVGMRKPRRIESLRDRAEQEDQAGPQLDPVAVLGGLDLQLEVFPSQVLRGEPDLPATVTLVGCGMPSPAPDLGDIGVVFVREDGWGKFVQKTAESGYGVDPAYLRKVRNCVAGDCGEEE